MKLILLIAFTLSLASCGGGSSPETTNSSISPILDGEQCSENIHLDVHLLKAACKDADEYGDRTSVKECIARAEDMMFRYPKINCYAYKNGSSETYKLNLEEIKKIQNQYTHENYLNYLDGEKCGKYFIVDLYRVTHDSCNGLTGNYFHESCEKDLSDFLVKYRTFHCYDARYSSDDVFYSYATYKEIYSDLVKKLNRK